MNKIGIKNYYFVVLPPLLIIETIFFLSDVDMLFISFFLIAYTWRTLHAHPKFDHRPNGKSRYSIISILYSYSFYFSNLLEKIKIPKWMICHVVINLPLMTISIVISSWAFTFGIFGTTLFDCLMFIYFFINKKYISPIK